MKKIVAASTVLLGMTILLASCSKESMSKPGNTGSETTSTSSRGSGTIMATVASGHTYILNLGVSSTATIIQQALHYQSSETIAGEGDGILKYRYIPALNYTGADEVMINYTSPATSGSGNCLGNSHPTGVTSKYLTIKLNVTN